MSTVAGRTEFLRALVGLSAVESGTVSLNGETYTPSRPAAAASRGLVYVTEERKTDGIVAQMSGLDNVALPVLKRYTRFGWLRRGAMDEAALEILGKLQIRGDVTSPTSASSPGASPHRRGYEGLLPLQSRRYPTASGRQLSPSAHQRQTLDSTPPRPPAVAFHLPPLGRRVHE